MNNLLYLDNDDFQCRNTEKGQVLSINTPDMTLVLFYSTKCPHCHDLIPIFKNLPDIVKGCNFGFINISKHPNIVEWASNTNTKITYVPLVIMYVNGLPYARYDGPRDLNQIKNFIIEINKHVQDKINFTNSKQNNVVINSSTLGIPMEHNEKVCYLPVKIAYKNQT